MENLACGRGFETWVERHINGILSTGVNFCHNRVFDSFPGYYSAAG